MAAFDAITEAPPPSRTWEDDEDELFRKHYSPVTLERSTSGEAHMADSEGLASSKAKKVACAIYLLRTEADQNSDSANTVLISLPAETALPPEMSLEWIREGSNLKHPAIQAEYLPSGHLVDGVAAAVMSYKLWKTL
eukprot:jgi/Mesen1/2508/ME000016S01869